MEQVLVVPRAPLEALLPEQPLYQGDLAPVIDYILQTYRFEDRATAEYNDSVKQVIPYVAIQRDDAYFVLRRLKKQTETRLHDQLSIGVGGHINPVDAQECSVLEAGLNRELAEEVELLGSYTLACVGIINQNLGSVSDYHLGLAYLLLTDGDVRVKETEKMEGKWVPKAELEKNISQLETWSQVLLQGLLSLPSDLNA